MTLRYAAAFEKFQNYPCLYNFLAYPLQQTENLA